MCPRFPTVARFLLLFAFLYAAFGVNSPFFPAFLNSRGLEAREIAVVLASGTAVRLVAAPLAGRIADAFDAARASLVVSIGGTAVSTLAYVLATGFSPLLLVSVLSAVALGPVAPLADTVALAAAEQRGSGGRRAFEYGWARGAGSAAFIAGTLISGHAVERFGLVIIVILQASLLGVAALFALAAPQSRLQAPEPDSDRSGASIGAIRRLLSIPIYRRVLVVAALVFGSHAMHDSFAVIRWREAGIGPEAISVLWSESVAAEVIVFFLVGGPLLDRFGTAASAALCACAGVLRWVVMAQSAWLPALALVQPLHGLTFALLHLACMRIMAETVPSNVAATALTLYGTLGAGLSGVLLTLASGPLYASLGATGFFAMAGLCALAIPVALTLKLPRASPELMRGSQ